MAVNTHRTPSPNLLSLFWSNVTLCARSVFTQLWNCREKFFFEPGNCDLMTNEGLPHCETWIVAASNLPGKHTGHFSLHYNNCFVQVFSFLKQHATCHILLGSHLTAQFHPIRVIIGMAIKTHRTLSPDFFSLGMVQCALGVYITLKQPVNIFVNLRTGAGRVISIFPL